MCARRARRPSPQDDEQLDPIIVEPPPGQDNGLPPGLDEPDDAGADDFGDFLALADESFRDATWFIWRRAVPGEPVVPGSKGTPKYVCKLVGPIDLDTIAQRVGGGSFRICGYRGTPFRKFIERPFEVDGPRKVHDTERAPAPAPPTNGSAPADMAAAVTAAIAAGFARLEQKLQPPPAAAPAMSFKDLIEAAKLMRPDPVQQENPNENTINAMMGLIKQGIELGATREPGAGTDWVAVIDKAMPIADKLVSALGQRRGVPPRRPPQGQPVPPSRAEVIETPPPAPEPEPAPEGVNVRMAAVVDSLARSIEAMGTEREVEPADFAATAETVLLPAELSMLRLATTDSLMAELLQTVDQFPVFKTPQARVFVDAVLSDLRGPTE
jgi:hypothetical protein